MPTKLNHLRDLEIAAWVRNELTEEEAQTIEAHLEQCQECARKLDSFDGAKDTFLDWVRSSCDTHREATEAENVEHHQWIGSQLGRYEVLGVLGAGGMGVVLEACDTAIGRRVALKVLDERLASDSFLLQRFLSEARVAGRLNHPNVLALHDIAEAQGVHFLVLELAEQGSADDLLRRSGPLPPGLATDIIKQAAKGLLAAHTAGLIHRDLKPANLLITADGTVKLADFGVAKYTPPDGLRLTRDGQLIGTPHFMSPEQCAGKVVDVRSDIYSLGATYYSLLTGNVPYADAENLVNIVHAHCLADRPDPSTIVPSLPGECSAIVKRAMAVQPADRYQSIEELIADLKGCSLTPLPCKEEGPNANNPSMVRRLAIASGLAAIGGLAAGSFLRGYWTTGNLSTSGANPVPLQPARKAPLRVGILHSLTGYLAPSEEPVIAGYTMAIESINAQGGIDGRPIEPVLVDGCSNASKFAAGARRLIKNDEVCAVFGGGSSHCRRQIVPVVEDLDHLLVYPFTSEGIESSPNVLYLGGIPSQTVLPCVQWAHSFHGCRRFYLVGINSVRARVLSEMIRDVLQGFGLTPVGEAFVAPGTTSMSEVVDSLAYAKADAVFDLLPGASRWPLVDSMERDSMALSYYSGGLHELLPLSLPELTNLRKFAVGTYFQALPSAHNRRFLTKFQGRFGARHLVTSAIEAGYSSIHLWAQGVAAASTTTPSEVRQAMCEQTFLAPGGSVAIDAASGYAYRQSLIGEYRSDGNYEIVYRSSRALSPSPYPASRTEAEWHYLLDTLRSEWGNEWSAQAGSPTLFH